MVKKASGGRVKESLGGRIFSVFNYVFVTLVAFTMIYPVLNVLAVSLSSYNAYLEQRWMIVPHDFSFAAYSYAMKNDYFWISYGNSIFLTAAGTILGLIITILTAYPLSRSVLKGKSFFMTLIILTMVFSAGMVPGYLNIRDLKLLNTLWALCVPGCFSAFNCILMLNFFKQLPIELIEAAEIDGASEPYILTKIVVPLSKAVIASISLFLAVGYWNSYFGAQIYITTREKWPIALLLKDILMSAQTAILESEGGDPLALVGIELQTTTIQYACIIITTVPMMSIYPFLQKHFAKGVMVGGIKG